MMDFENELNAFKEKTRAMCDAMDCPELLDDYLVEIEISRPTYYHFYEAGQQSKQAEIDALKEKLKKLEDHIFINYDDEIDDDQHSYWSGYNVALGEVAAIIKENNNDT